MGLGLLIVLALSKRKTRTRGPAVVTPFDHIFDSVGKRYSLEPILLKAIALAEHGGKVTADSASVIFKKNDPGEGHDVGLMQINQRTAKALGVLDESLLDPVISVDTAARLLLSLRRELGTKYSLETWIAAYNAGAPAIRKRGIFNPEYVAKVLDNMKRAVAG